MNVIKLNADPAAWIEVERGIPMFAKFAEGYKPECDGFIPLYAAPVDVKAIRAEALEEAAKVCEKSHYSDVGDYWAEQCAAAIRGLK